MMGQELSTERRYARYRVGPLPWWRRLWNRVRPRPKDADYIIFKVRRPKNREYTTAMAKVAVTIHMEFGPGDFVNQKDEWPIVYHPEG